MPLRHSFSPLQIPSKVLAEFDEEKQVEIVAPASWRLKPKDYIVYTRGQGSRGIAFVVSVGDSVEVDNPDCHGPAKVPGVLCRFEKIS